MAHEWNIRTHFEPAKVVKQETGGETMTQQHMAEATDINNIMKRYEKDGIIDHVNQYQGEYGDFTVMPDFHTAMNKIIDAQEMFLTLPASIRDKFGNDPGAFVEFASDENNLDAMRELGLAPPAPKEEQKTPPKEEAKKPAEKPKTEDPKSDA